MTKYKELVDALEARESFINNVDTKFKEAFCQEFSMFLGCKPEFVHSKMVSCPSGGNKFPVVRYSFVVSLDIPSNDTGKMNLSLDIDATTTPDGHDPYKFLLKLKNEHIAELIKNDNDSMTLGPKFYDKVHQIFIKKVSERGF